MNQLQVDIILPCYNPVDGWALTIVETIQHISSRLPECTFHCIVVNDGSTRGISEGEVEYLRQHLQNFQWIDQDKNSGKGHALREGISRSEADFLMYTDVDFPYTLDSMERCLKSVIKEKCDVALAVRNASYYHRLPLSRRWISKVLQGMNKWLLSIPTADTQGGLKVFNREGKRHFLATTIDRYLFDLEFIALCASDADMTILPVQSDLREDVQFSTVRLSILLGESKNFLRLMKKRWFG